MVKKQNYDILLDFRALIYLLGSSILTHKLSLYQESKFEKRTKSREKCWWRRAYNDLCKPIQNIPRQRTHPHP